MRVTQRMALTVFVVLEFLTCAWSHWLSGDVSFPCHFHGGGRLCIFHRVLFIHSFTYLSFWFLFLCFTYTIDLIDNELSKLLWSLLRDMSCRAVL